jgi:hypothetical protein
MYWQEAAMKIPHDSGKSHAALSAHTEERG